MEWLLEYHTQFTTDFVIFVLLDICFFLTDSFPPGEDNKGFKPVTKTVKEIIFKKDISKCNGLGPCELSF